MPTHLGLHIMLYKSSEEGSVNNNNMNKYILLSSPLLISTLKRDHGTKRYWWIVFYTFFTHIWWRMNGSLSAFGKLIWSKHYYVTDRWRGSFPGNTFPDGRIISDPVRRSSEFLVRFLTLWRHIISVSSGSLQAYTLILLPEEKYKQARLFFIISIYNNLD